MCSHVYRKPIQNIIYTRIHIIHEYRCERLRARELGWWKIAYQQLDGKKAQIERGQRRRRRPRRHRATDKITPNVTTESIKRISLPATMPRRNQQRKTNTARQSGRRKAKPIKFNPREIEIEQQQQQLHHHHHSRRMSACEHNNAADGSAPDGMDNAITIGIGECDSTNNEYIERTNQRDNWRRRRTVAQKAMP